MANEFKLTYHTPYCTLYMFFLAPGYVPGALPYATSHSRKAASTRCSSSKLGLG